MNKEKKDSFINKIYGIKARQILEDIITEEEKSSLKHLEHFMNRIREENSLPDVEIGLDTSIEDILYLIEKLLKEIEELKDNELDYTTIFINGFYEGKKFYKDKIKKLQKDKDILYGVIDELKGEKDE